MLSYNAQTTLIFICCRTFSFDTYLYMLFLRIIHGELKKLKLINIFIMTEKIGIVLIV